MPAGITSVPYGPNATSKLVLPRLVETLTFESPLSPLMAEVDETYVGGLERNKHESC